MAKALAPANMSKILRDMANGLGNTASDRSAGLGCGCGYRPGIMHKYAKR